MPESDQSTSRWTYSKPTLLNSTDTGYDMKKYSKEIETDFASTSDKVIGTEVLVIKAFPINPGYGSNLTDSMSAGELSIESHFSELLSDIDAENEEDNEDEEEGGRIVAVGVIGPYDSEEHSECKVLILDWRGVDSAHSRKQLANSMVLAAKQHVHAQERHFCLETYSEPTKLQDTLRRLYSHASLGLTLVPAHKSKNGFATYYSLHPTVEGPSALFEKQVAR